MGSYVQQRMTVVVVCGSGGVINLVRWCYQSCDVGLCFIRFYLVDTQTGLSDGFTDVYSDKFLNEDYEARSFIPFSHRRAIIQFWLI